MNYLELINHVGAENINVQVLEDCLVQASTSVKKGITKITFGTQVITANDLMLQRPDMVGLIVWLPRSKLPAD